MTIMKRYHSWSLIKEKFSLNTALVCSTLNHGFHLRIEAVSRFPSQLQLITGTIILHRSYRQGFLESEKSHCIKQSYRYTVDHFSRNIKLTSAIIQWDCS